MKKPIVTLTLISLIAISSLSLILLKPANAQTPTPTKALPIPSVPQFTLQYVNEPNYTLIVTVKNQPYDPELSLYYTVRVKDHNSAIESWRYPYAQLNPIADLNVGASNVDFPKQTAGSDYTNISIVSQSSLFLLGGENDVQVAALEGEVYANAANAYKESFFGWTSGWSSTQTITIPTGYTSNPTPTPTHTKTVQPPPTISPTPTVPEFSWLMILLLFLSIFSIVVLIGKRKLSDGYD
jgi:hypothetical protein